MTRINHKSVPLAIGVTGGIACGKSEFGQCLADAGFHVVDTDALAHEAIRRGGAAFEDVVEHFGTNILNEHGEIDRKTLGALVFGHSQALADLNRLVHPPVLHRCRSIRAETLARGVHFAALIPLLFESGATDAWHYIVCISANEDTILARLRQRGLSTEQAYQRISAQWTIAEKKKNADFVLENNGSLEDFRQRARAWIARIIQ